MRHLMTTALISASMATASLAATSTQPAGFAVHAATSDTASGLWLAKNNGNGNGNGKAKGQVKKQAKGPKPGKDKPAKVAANEKPGKGNGNGNAAKAVPPGQAKKADAGAAKVKRGNGPERDADWDARAERVMQVTAPDGRNLAVLGAAALGLATPGIISASTPVDDLLTYRNCPPGLAKKDPPCVPPGLAKEGVVQEEWLQYDAEDLDRIWLERRGVFLDDDRDYTRRLLLRSDQIATLYGLDPLPEGQYYGLIDGMPVLLDADDYRGLLLVNELAEAVNLGDNISIAPTAALTQQELMRLYRLPELPGGRNYAVLNGQVISLSDSEYETLQLIRIARAIL